MKLPDFRPNDHGESPGSVLAKPQKARHDCGIDVLQKNNKSGEWVGNSNSSIISNYIPSYQKERGIECDTLTENHWKEWLASGVDAEVIAANVVSLNGDDALEKIARTAIEEAAPNAQFATAPIRKIQDRYQSLMAGGWWVSGLDPLADWAPMEWGQLKPTSPRIDEKGEVIKYEAPAKEATRLFFPVVPMAAARKIIERHNLTATTELDPTDAWNDIQWGKGFWAWLIQHPEIPVVICEGAKKAGALLAAGYAAVALPGVWNGRVPKPKDEWALAKWVPKLKAELKAIAQAGRRIIIAFDADEKIATQMQVWKASESLMFLFQKAKCVPSFAAWDNAQGKGFDDLMQAIGVDAAAAIIAQAQSYQEWRINKAIASDLKRPASMAINQPMLNIELSQLPARGIIAIKSPMGTGKTQHFMKRLAEQSDRALVLGHLINLTKGNCARLGATYRTDLDRAVGRFIGADGGQVFKVGSVIDSLMAFRPEQFGGDGAFDIFADEICQLLRAVLTSSTIKDRRGAILTRLHEFVQAARRVIVADADLSDWALKYLEQLRGDGQGAYLILNEHTPQGFNFEFCEASEPSYIIQQALDTAASELNKGSAGKHTVVATDAKGTAQTVSEMARGLGLVTLEITSETSGGETESAFITNPTAFLNDADLPMLIIYSPSMATGASIENPNISHVYGIFRGASIGDTDILQMLNRVRVKCDRTIWVKKRGKAYSRLGTSTFASTLKDTLKQITKVNAQVIRQELSESLYSGLDAFTWDTDPHINTYCQVEAAKNGAMGDLRAIVLRRLTQAGNHHRLTHERVNEPTKNAATDTREDLKLQDAMAIEEAPSLSDQEAQALHLKQADGGGLEPSERYAMRKYTLARFYLAEVTAQLVLDDKAGERRSKIKNFETLTNKALARKVDKESIEAQAEKSPLFTPQDIKRTSLKSEMRKHLGLLQWIEREDSWMEDDPALLAFRDAAWAARTAIKQALNYTVKPEATAQKILSELLAQVGVRCSMGRSQIDGVRKRHYSINQKALAILRGVCDTRAQDRERRELMAAALKNPENPETGTPKKSPDSLGIQGVATPPLSLEKSEGKKTKPLIQKDLSLTKSGHTPPLIKTTTSPLGQTNLIPSAETSTGTPAQNPIHPLQRGGDS